MIRIYTYETHDGTRFKDRRLAIEHELANADPRITDIISKFAENLRDTEVALLSRLAPYLSYHMNGYTVEWGNKATPEPEETAEETDEETDGAEAEA